MATNVDIVRPSATAEGLTREAPRLQKKIGVPTRVGRTSHRFAYDRTAGAIGAAVDYVIVRAAIMSLVDAKARLTRIHMLFQIERESDANLYSFDNALFLCYAMNGGSQLGPASRMKFGFINARTDQHEEFMYSTVVDEMGVDLRRFFRAYANEVVDSCRRAYNADTSASEEAYQLKMEMKSIAVKRGVSRCPWLIADVSADATNLTSEELAVAIQSSSLVIGSSVNSVDKVGVRTIRSRDERDQIMAGNASDDDYRM